MPYGVKLSLIVLAGVWPVPIPMPLFRPVHRPCLQGLQDHCISPMFGIC